MIFLPTVLFFFGRVRSYDTQCLKRERIKNKDMQVKSHEKSMLNKIMFWKTVFTLFFLKAKKPSLTTACKELWLTISEERNGNSIGYSAAIYNHMKQTNWTNKNMICKTAFTQSILIDKAALFIAKCSVLTNSLQYLQQI